MAKELAMRATPVPNERRIAARFSLEVPLRIHCRTGDLVQGRTVDVSESGISAIVLHGIMVGQAVELGFQLAGGPNPIPCVSISYETSLGIPVKANIDSGGKVNGIPE